MVAARIERDAQGRTIQNMNLAIKASVLREVLRKQRIPFTVNAIVADAEALFKARQDSITREQQRKIEQANRTVDSLNSAQQTKIELTKQEMERLSRRNAIRADLIEGRLGSSEIRVDSIVYELRRKDAERARERDSIYNAEMPRRFVVKAGGGAGAFGGYFYTPTFPANGVSAIEWTRERGRILQFYGSVMAGIRCAVAKEGERGTIIGVFGTVGSLPSQISIGRNPAFYEAEAGFLVAEAVRVSAGMNLHERRFTPTATVGTTARIFDWLEADITATAMFGGVRTIFRANAGLSVRFAFGKWY